MFLFNVFKNVCFEFLIRKVNKDVFQTFSKAPTEGKCPEIQLNLEKCFKEIQAKYAGDKAALKEVQKEKNKEAFNQAHGYETFRGILPRFD